MTALESVHQNKDKVALELKIQKLGKKLHHPQSFTKYLRLFHL